MDIEITNDNLKRIKEELFNKNITDEEKNNIINQINETIDKLLIELESESDPIDE